MNYRRDIVKKCVAQMCINLGWESITASALDTLANVLENYFFSMAHNIHLASQLSGSPGPSLQDLCSSFEKFDINLSDLSEYILQADHIPLPYSIPYFPALRHKTTSKYEQKTSSNKDNLTSVEKKQGTECLTPIKNAKVIPEEAESSQYEMKSFSLVTLENGDLFPEIKGHVPNSKICKPVVEEQKFPKVISKNISSNAAKAFAEVCKEKVEPILGKVSKQISSINEDHDENSNYNKNEIPKVSIVTPKKHRKPTIKEAFIAKKKQSKSAKLASSMVKVDHSSDANFELRKRPGRKPKKIPKSRIHVIEDDEMNANARPLAEETSGTVEKGCTSLMEVVDTVVGDALVGEGTDAMLEDDLELGAVNDEMLVEIADHGGDSPLSHLPGMAPNRELFPSSELFNSTCPANQSGNADSHVDVEEEILPWSDDDKLVNDQTSVHKATGLELILRSQGDGSSISSTLFKPPEKHQKDNDIQLDVSDKKKFKKLKKLKKKSQKPEKIPKVKKNKFDAKVEAYLIPAEETPSESQEALSSGLNDKYVSPKVNKPEEMVENDCEKAARKLSESSDYNSELEAFHNNSKQPLQPSSDFMENTQTNVPEYVEVPHKKKKKKGKRKLEDPYGTGTPKPKKSKKESIEMPIIPKLTLKFGGATVCGGDTSSPNTQKDHSADFASRHSLPAPIKLVIKPFANAHGSQLNQRGASPAETFHRSQNNSPLPLQRSLSPDRMSIPSVALSSRSPSPNDIARLASGPSNRKNLSPIYSESPSPPHESHSSSKAFHSKKHESPDVKPKIKESKSTPIKSSPVSKSFGSKSSKSAVISETVGKITKANGEIIWICPTCGCPDSGTPMIGCDRCDDWYHWVCVNIVKEPPAEMNWYCVRCLNQNPSLKGQGPNKRGRPAGKGKSKK